MADTSLIWNIIARDKTTAVLNKLEARASSVGKTMGLALGPALLPVAAVGVGAIASLGAALAGAGVAGGVFGAVVKSAMTDVTEAATKVEDLNDKIDLYKREAQLAAAAGQDNSKYIKKQADATLELQARLKNLPPATRDATMGFLQMKSDWKDFVEQNKPAVFNLMASGYKLLGSQILKLQPFFDMAMSAVNRLFGRIQGAVEGGLLDRLATTAAPALRTLTSIIINVSTAFAKMFGKLGAAQGQGILEWIEGMTRRWAQWASATQKGTGINVFIEYLKANGPRVASTLGNLAQAVFHIAQAISPLAPISLAIASALASLIQAIPPNVLTAIVAGFIAFNVAMRVYALGSAIATAAQWAMNSALLASPITWIVLAIAALVAIIVLVATKTRFFQTIWNAVWGFMKGVGAWFAGPFANFFVSLWNKLVSGFNWVKSGISSAINAVKAKFEYWGLVVNVATKLIISKVTSVVNWVKAAPGKVKSALSNMFSPMWSGFRSFLNKIIRGWNSLHFGIPGFSFAGISVGGFDVGVPRIPYLAKGGNVTAEGLAFIHRGETVTPAAKVTPYRNGQGEAHATITLKSDGSRLMNLLLEILREAIRERGGDVVKVLSPA
jgi:hypothetical protein